MTTTEINVTAKVLFVLLFYVLISFVEWTIWISQWHSISRAIYVALVIYAITYKKEEENKTE